MWARHWLIMLVSTIRLHSYIVTQIKMHFKIIYFFPCLIVGARGSNINTGTVYRAERYTFGGGDVFYKLTLGGIELVH